MRTAAKQCAFIIFILGIGATPILAQCPSAFRLSGSGIDKSLKSTTPSAWNKMLPKQWVDKGGHFLSQAKTRGPQNGINTPSDLESEVLKKVREVPEGTPNRWQIELPILNSAGKRLRVIYDYAGKATSKCELVTLSF